MKSLINNFLVHLEVVRNLSPKTTKAYQHDLYKFYDFLNNENKVDINKITKKEITQFLTHLATKGNKKPNSITARARKLSSIKSFFNYLIREEIISINPATNIDTPKIPDKEPCYLDEEECQKLIYTIKQTATPFYKVRDVTIISLFLTTGIRLSELVGLSINDINLKEKSIKVKRKGNKEQTVPLLTDTVKLLKLYLKKRPNSKSDKLFISKKDNGIRANTVYYMVKKYLKEAGINKEKLSVHSLRHTFCTILLKRDVSLFIIKELAGHRSLETTKKIPTRQPTSIKRSS